MVFSDSEWGILLLFVLLLACFYPQYHRLKAEQRAARSESRAVDRIAAQKRLEKDRKRLRQKGYGKGAVTADGVTAPFDLKLKCVVRACAPAAVCADIAGR